METVYISVGKYRFKIINNTLSYDDQIYSRNFKIGGNVSDCVKKNPTLETVVVGG